MAEGLAREFVNKLQNMRKTADLEVTQRINVTFHGDADVMAAVEGQLDYVKNETLALSCTAADRPASGGETWDLNGHACVIAITPA